MIQIDMSMVGLPAAGAAVAALPAAIEVEIYPHALSKSMFPIKRVARKRGFVFQDGTGDRDYDRKRGKPSQRLRKTIRISRIRAIYGGVSYRKGRAALISGGKGARHGYLVHAGHGGPIKAKPYPYMTEALFQAAPEAMQEFAKEFRARFPQAATRSRIEAAKIAQRMGLHRLPRGYGSGRVGGSRVGTRAVNALSRTLVRRTRANLRR